MSNPDEPDGGHYVESMLLVFLFCLYLVFGLYMAILWLDMIDYEQYIHGRLEALISLQSMREMW